MKRYGKPFVKWAGGKGSLLHQLDVWLPRELLSKEDITYIEPFVGGGAMLFYLLKRYSNIRHVVINDINEDLMTCYTLIKEDPQRLVNHLSVFEKEFYKLDVEERSRYYYDVRDSYNLRSSSREELAAQFYFLNHTCFNGLYRVNVNSKFNVPYGKISHPAICDRQLIETDHVLLNSVDLTILCGPYEGVQDYIKDGDRTFVYLDPPYLPISVTSYFKQYSNIPFAIKEQEALKVFCDQLTENGCLFMLSNSDCKLDDGATSYFEQLYANYTFHRVMARRMINSKAGGRGHLSEVLIKNYPDE